MAVKLHACLPLVGSGTQSLSKGKEFHFECGGDIIKLNAATEN